MIKELRLYNWKSFEKSHLYIDPLSFVIGVNASGKSNIFDALSFLQKISQGMPINEAAKSIRGGVDWMMRKGSPDFRLTVLADSQVETEEIEYSVAFRKMQNNNEIEICDEQLIRRKKKSVWERKLFYTNNPRMQYDSPIIPTTFYSEHKGRQKTRDVNRMSTVLSQIEGIQTIKSVKDKALEMRSLLQAIFVLSPNPSAMRNYCKLDSKLLPDASNVAGVWAGMTDEKKMLLETQITKYIKLLPEQDIIRVWTEKIGRFQTDAMIYCEESWKQGESIEMDARGMSDGTLRLIAIIMGLLTLPQKSLMVIEEIDNGLHPSRTKDLIGLLKALGDEHQIDVLCSTHNPVLIDALGPTMLPFISYVSRNKENGYSEIKLLEDKDNLAKLLAGGGFGSLMINDKL